ncbi:MAG: phosphoribosyltransferase family protein [Bacteroidota bacterium]
MSIKDAWHDLGQGLWSLLFPNVCLHCRTAIAPRQEPALCVSCDNTLAETGAWTLAENELTDRLKGRLPLVFGAALYHFREDTVCQSIIHHLKYYRRPELGDQFGERFGTLLRQVPALRDLDGIVPVPIHPKRLHERGYNQAAHLAAGLAKALERPVFPDALVRSSFKGSQTTKGRLDRLENVRNSFTRGKGDFSGQHLLLVDDVLTTGATLDICGNLLLEHHPDCRLSIATLAIAG